MYLFKNEYLTLNNQPYNIMRESRNHFSHKKTLEGSQISWMDRCAYFVYYDHILYTVTEKSVATCLTDLILRFT